MVAPQDFSYFIFLDKKYFSLLLNILHIIYNEYENIKLHIFNSGQVQKRGLNIHLDGYHYRGKSFCFVYDFKRNEGS